MDNNDFDALAVEDQDESNQKKVITKESDMKSFLKTDAPAAFSQTVPTTTNPSTSAPDFWCCYCCNCDPMFGSCNGCDCNCSECCDSIGDCLSNCCSTILELFSSGLEGCGECCFQCCCEGCCSLLNG